MAKAGPGLAIADAGAHGLHGQLAGRGSVSSSSLVTRIWPGQGRPPTALAGGTGHHRQHPAYPRMQENKTEAALGTTVARDG